MLRLRRPAVTVLAACAVAIGILLPVAPAVAAVPSTPVFPRAIDAYPRYETESGCDPVAKPGALEVQRIIRATWGSSLGMNTPRACSSANSGHEEGRAIDWMTNVRIPSQKVQADDLIAWLLATDSHGNQHAMARRLGISYLIWDSRKFYLFDTGDGWTEYSNCLTVRTGAGDDNTCHRNHVHISMSWAGALAQTSWYTAQGQSRSPCPEPASAGAPPTLPTRGLGYVPVTPARLLDTRSNYVYPEGCQLAREGRLDIGVTGVGGVPASGVAAVAVNLTGVAPSGTTWVAAYPAGAPFGGTSSVNVPHGRDAAALVVVPVGANGRISLRNGPFATDLVVDVVGYYPADGTGARFTATAADRRHDATVEQGYTTVQTGGPAGTTAVVANVTLDAPTVPGHASLVPQAQSAPPTTSSVNITPGATMANRAFARTANGSVALWTSARTRAVVDVVGYLGSGGAMYHPLTPARVADSRTGLGGVPRLSGGQEVTVQLTGRGGVPQGAGTVVLTLTLDGVTQPSHVTAWRTGTPLPTSSDVNVGSDAPRANLVLAAVDASGRASLRLDQGSGHVIVDVLGYYS